MPEKFNPTTEPTNTFQNWFFIKAVSQLTTKEFQDILNKVKMDFMK